MANKDERPTQQNFTKPIPPVGTWKQSDLPKTGTANYGSGEKYGPTTKPVSADMTDMAPKEGK